MGAGLSYFVGVQNSLQVTNTSIVQSASNSCSASCSNIISGNTIIIDDATVGGINATQKCVAIASCYINNSFDAQVDNILKSANSQTNSYSNPVLAFKANVGVNVSNQKQYITNQISQLMQNSCSAVASNVFSNNNVFVMAGATVADGINWNQDNTAQASCTFNNTAKVINYNTAQTQSTQSNQEATTLGALLAIGAFLLIAIFGIILISGMFKSKSKQAEANARIAEANSSTTPATTSSSSTLSNRLATAQALAPLLA